MQGRRVIKKSSFLSEEWMGNEQMYDRRSLLPPCLDVMPMIVSCIAADVMLAHAMLMRYGLTRMAPRDPKNMTKTHGFKASQNVFAV